MSGRRSKTLTPEMIERLRRFRSAKRYSIPQLKLAMDAPCNWQTLQRALDGLPVYELTFEFIEGWLDKFVPVSTNGESADLRDFKRAAANDEGLDDAGKELHQARLRTENR